MAIGQEKARVNCFCSQNQANPFAKNGQTKGDSADALQRKTVSDAVVFKPHQFTPSRFDHGREWHSF